MPLKMSPKQIIHSESQILSPDGLTLGMVIVVKNLNESISDEKLMIVNLPFESIDGWWVTVKDLSDTPEVFDIPLSAYGLVPYPLTFGFGDHRRGMWNPYHWIEPVSS